MRFAIDVMGGDHAPDAILKGCLDAVPLLDDGDIIVLVGLPEVVEPAAAQMPGKLEAAAASQVVAMDDSPVAAVRGKPDSSIAVMTKLASGGEANGIMPADVAISAGNTGACVAAAQLRMRTLPGVARPGIAVTFPTAKGPVILCDAGANPTPQAKHLHQYAIMAGVYTEAAAGVEKPKVGLLSIGEEESKGNSLTKEANALLAATPGIEFLGNVEGRDVMTKANGVDVIVCDGFVGNTVLKFAEGMVEMLVGMMGESGAGLSKKLDWQQFGGAPLLGAAGYLMISHGSSGPRAITNAIRSAKQVVASGVNETIIQRIGGSTE